MSELGPIFQITLTLCCTPETNLLDPSTLCYNVPATFGSEIRPPYSGHPAVYRSVHSDRLQIFCGLCLMPCCCTSPDWFNCLLKKAQINKKSPCSLNQTHPDSVLNKHIMTSESQHLINARKIRFTNKAWSVFFRKSDIFSLSSQSQMTQIELWLLSHTGVSDKNIFDKWQITISYGEKYKTIRAQYFSSAFARLDTMQSARMHPAGHQLNHLPPSTKTH